MCIHTAEPIEHSEQLWGGVHRQLLAEHICLSVGLFDFRGPKSLECHQRWPKGELEVQFSLDTLWGIWKGGGQLQPPGEVRRGFDIRRALDSPLAGPLPVANGLRVKARLAV